MQFPRVRHWFSAAAMVTLCPTALTGALGLVALMPPVLEPAQFWAALGLVVVVTLVTWGNAALQELAKDNAAKAVDDLLERFGQREAVRANPAVSNYRGLSSDELRERVHAVAQRMRTMEAGFKDARRRDIFRGRGNEDWDEHTTRMMAQGDEHQLRWQMDLKPEAIALWDEVRRRVEGPPPYPPRPYPPGAFHGSLAGVSPLDEAATELERLVRQLP